MSVEILAGDCRQTLQDLEGGSIQCCITAPPQWSRKSDLPAEHPDRACDVRLVPSPYTYLVELNRIFRQVRRVLKDDGTLWIRLGDLYRPRGLCGIRGLFGLPSRLAIALQADGWSLQADLAIARPEPSAESDAGWPVAPQERVLLLSKSERYYCDPTGLSEPLAGLFFGGDCILAGSRPGDAVLDPFGGNGMTASAARSLERNAVICELNPERVNTLRETLEPVKRTG